jgi:hypothetical protein
VSSANKLLTHSSLFRANIIPSVNAVKCSIDKINDNLDTDLICAQDHRQRKIVDERVCDK